MRRADPPLVEILAPLWPHVVGRGIANQSRPATFLAGTLTVVTSCPTWAAQLQQMREEVRAQVNHFLGSSVIKKLRVKVELTADSQEVAAAQRAVGPDPVPPDTPAPDGAGSLEPEISRILARSFVKYFACQKRKVH